MKKKLPILTLASTTIILIVVVLSFTSRYESSDRAESNSTKSSFDIESAQKESLFNKNSQKRANTTVKPSQPNSENIEQQIREKIASGEKNPEEYRKLLRKHLLSKFKSKQSDTSLPKNINSSKQDGPPEKYSLSKTSSTSASVNLEGGEATIEMPEQEEKPNLNRLIQGHVILENGDPVTSVPVLVGEGFRHRWNHLSGNYGSVSRSDGRFSLYVESDIGYAIIAIHPTLGWSQPVSIQPGYEPLEIDLVIPEPGAIEGIVTKNGQPEYADLWLRFLSTKKLELYQESNSTSGEYRFDNLPPGDYTITVSLGTGDMKGSFGGSATPLLTSITLKVGQTVKLDIELPSGGLIVAQTKSYDGWSPDLLEYFLFKRSMSIGPSDDLRQIAKEIPEKDRQYVLIGGTSSGPMQFHDLLPGDYTLCIKGKKRDNTPSRQKCQLVPVHAHSNVIEITLSLDK